MADDLLPRFRRPPVVETILGVQFHPLVDLGAARLGVFWKALGEFWNQVTEAPPLAPEFERFGSDQVWATGLRFFLPQKPAVRLQITNSDKDRMIQVQNGRLHYNWLGHEGGEYPRYSKLRPEFDEVLCKFQKFLADEGLGQFKANQWEVTYINHLPKGTVWMTPSDWPSLLRQPSAFLCSPKWLRFESFGGEWIFEIPEQQGRLHVDIRHGRREGPEPQELLTMTFVARGRIQEDGANGMSLSEGLDLGRSTIVSTFAALTSDEAHKFWERF